MVKYLYNNITGCRYKCPCLVKYDISGSMIGDSQSEIDIYVDGKLKDTLLKRPGIFPITFNPTINNQEGAYFHTTSNYNWLFIKDISSIVHFYVSQKIGNIDSCFPARDNISINYNDSNNITYNENTSEPVHIGNGNLITSNYRKPKVIEIFFN